MARYTVVCPKEFDDALVDQWLRSDSTGRKRLTKASHLIQQWLRQIPLDLGQPLSSETTVRVWVFSVMGKPVIVEYQVQDEDRIVTVLRVKVAT